MTFGPVMVGVVQPMPLADLARFRARGDHMKLDWAAIGDVATWASMAAGWAAFIELRLRHVREARAEAWDRLEVQSQKSKHPNAIFVTLQYEPPSAHTTYGARIRSRGPSRLNNVEYVKIGPGSYDYQPQALQLPARGITIDIRQGMTGKFSGLFLSLAREGEDRTVLVEIFDQATNKVEMKRGFHLKI